MPQTTFPEPERIHRVRRKGENDLVASFPQQQICRRGMGALRATLFHVWLSSSFREPEHLYSICVVSDAAEV